MRKSLGARLRLQREERRLTIASIAAATKIHPALFLGLEQDDVARWPPGIFRRSFVRAYADAIGLDPDAVCREFMEQFPEAGEPRTITAPSPLAKHMAQWHRVLTTPDSATTNTPMLQHVSLRVLRDSKWGTTALDAAMVLLLSLIALGFTGRLWTPLALVALSYIVGATLLLGKSPALWVIERSSREGRLDDDASLGSVARPLP